MKSLAHVAMRAIAGIALLVGASTTHAASPLADVVEIWSGFGQTCARTVSGGVWCWGMTFSGPGDGSGGSYPAPVPVSELSSGVAAIAVGSSHACALTAAGGVKCWGENSSGQLGDGTTTTRFTPVNVTGLSNGVAAIWAGYGHTCALTSNGGMKCWGSNYVGQLGDGTTTSRSQPVDVVGLGSGVTAGTAGGGHSCALVGGAAYCWGYNFNGELGDGTQVQRNTPVLVSGLGSGVTSVRAGGNHTCAVMTGGAPMCWGSNSNGQLGVGSSGNPRTTPQAVAGLSSGVASLTLGGYHTCAVLGGGSVKCWGSNVEGQLGIGNTTSQSAPVDVASFGAPVSAMAAGGSHTCAIGGDAKVRCSGVNSQGELGRGLITTRDTLPALVQGFVHTPLENVVSVSAGFYHACALLASGSVKCWGSNLYGELGDGSTTARAGPVDVMGLTSGVIAIASKESSSCAVTSAGGVKCWGRNHRGQLGDGTMTDRSIPVDVSGVSGATAVWMGGTHSCAAVTGDAVKCWGDNGFGQLGDGTSVSPRLTPVDVTGLGSAVVSGAAGSRHTCAVMSGGGLKCWGENSMGQLGDGTTTNRSQPVDVSGLTSGVAAVAAGDFFTCALTTGGGVRCWGFNYAGRLGIGTSGLGDVSRTTPQTPVGLQTGVSRIAIGLSSACAVMVAGTVRCWGLNFFGELGFPGNPDIYTGSPTPTEVQYPVTDPVTIAMGLGLQCVATSAGRASCWGYNSRGQLGRGFIGFPVEVGHSPTVGVFATQTITFAPIADRDINASPFTVTASASSGLAVTFTSLTTPICTVSGTTVTLVANGACSIAADQAGNLEFLAERVVRSFAVTGSPLQPGRLANISSRAQVQTGHNVMIAGLIIAPDQSWRQKTVVIRARGPSLTAQGVPGVLANPKLQVVRSHDQAILATNDDWQQASNASAIQASGFAPSDPAESAVMLTLLGARAYTAVVSGADGGTGVAIVEVFEVDSPDVPLFNISTRAQVLTGNDVLIGGFVTQGDKPRQVIVRARGPSMAQQGVTGLLANPMLQLFSGQTQIAFNDDWQSDPNAGQLGIYAPADARESAILITLNPGAYTAIVTGRDATTGIGIVEVFAVP